MERVILMGCALLAQAASAQKTYTPGERAWPWHDRVDGWLMVDIPAGLEQEEPVPQQSCTGRSLLLPKGDLAAVTIGINDGDIPLIPPDLAGRVVDTGRDFHIQAPGGGQKLVYSVFTFRNPPPRTTFTGFKAGVVLLALREVTMSEADAPNAAELPAASGILPSDQEFAAQEWPFGPGERRVRMHVEEPKAGINANTGMMLCLHNWGGKYDQPTYIQWCKAFADRYNVVTGNVCEANGQHGIDASGGSENSIASNICLNNSQGQPGRYVGICLRDTTHATVTGNRCLDDQKRPTQTQGIHESGKSDYNLFAANHLVGHSGRALVVVGPNSRSEGNLVGPRAGEPNGE